MTLLGGIKVLNTRPQPQGKSLSLAIEKAGGQVIECPALAIEPLKPIWLNRIRNVLKYRYAIFISANAVNFFFDELTRASRIWSHKIKNIAIGAGTAKALHAKNISVNLIPDRFDSEHLLSLTELQEIKNAEILLIKGMGGRTLIQKTLESRQAVLTIINVYRRIIPIIDKQFLYSLWKNDSVDIILFTSEEGMNNIFQLFGEAAFDWLCNKPCLVYSERIAESASNFGIKNIQITHPNEVIKALEQFKVKNER